MRGGRVPLPHAEAVSGAAVLAALGATLVAAVPACIFFIAKAVASEAVV